MLFSFHLFKNVKYWLIIHNFPRDFDDFYLKHEKAKFHTVRDVIILVKRADINHNLKIHSIFHQLETNLWSFTKLVFLPLMLYKPTGNNSFLPIIFSSHICQHWIVPLFDNIKQSGHNQRETILVHIIFGNVYSLQ